MLAQIVGKLNLMYIPIENEENVVNLFEKDIHFEPSTNMESFYIGVYHSKVKSDMTKAKQFYQYAASNECVPAMVNLAGIYETNNDYDQAKYWYLKASNNGNCCSAMIGLAAIYYQQEKNFEQAMFWYQKAADLDHSDAMNSLACLYIEKEHNVDKAEYWYLKAANLGHSCAMSNLAILYRHTDVDQSKYWYEKAANLGDETAMTELALIYEKEKNFEKAKYWYLKAVKHDNQESILNLAGFFERHNQIENGFLFIDQHRDQIEDKFFFEYLNKLQHPISNTNKIAIYQILEKLTFPKAFTYTNNVCHILQDCSLYKQELICRLIYYYKHNTN